MTPFLMKFVLCILLINGFEKTNALGSTGPVKSQSASAKSISKNPFAPNSEIFKIPASKTVNLDFRTSNEHQIHSQLLNVLHGLLTKKTVNQEKVILNIKPPKGSNTSSVQNITSLLRKDSLSYLPDVIVGAQSTIFKKKSGEISNLRITLYVVRQERPKKSPKKTVTPVIEKAKINITQSENITATIESVLKKLHENTTERNETYIFLTLVSPKHFSRIEINALKQPIKQIVHGLYPNTTVSTHFKLFYRRRSRIYALQIEIDIKPHSSSLTHTKLQKIEAKLQPKKPLMDTLNVTAVIFLYNSTKPKIASISLNGTDSIEISMQTVNQYLKSKLKNITVENVNQSVIFANISFTRSVNREEQQILEKLFEDLTQKLFPGFVASIRGREGGQKKHPKLNVQIVLKPKYKPENLKKIEETMSAQSLEDNLKNLKNDINNLSPLSQVVLGSQKMIKNDLSTLQKILASQEAEVHKIKIPIDLTEAGSTFSTQLDKILPRILKTIDESKQPLTLAFEVTIQNNSPRSSISSDICAIVKTLMNRVPERTQFGDVNLEITLTTRHVDHNMLENNIENSLRKMPFSPLEHSLPSKYSNQPDNGIWNTMNITNQEMDVSKEINETLSRLSKQIPSQNFTRKSLNISLVLPYNETSLSEEGILEILRRDINTLFPYSQILIQIQKDIANDLRILKLNIELKQANANSDEHEKDIEVIPIDLSSLGKNVNDDLQKLLNPLWSHLDKNKPMGFDLKLKPVNDIGRGQLANEICSIVDILTRSMPENIFLHDISLRTTVLPDEEDNENETEEDEQPDDLESHEDSFLPESFNFTITGHNTTKNLHTVLTNIIKDNVMNSTGIGSSLNLLFTLPKNETLAFKNTLEKIKDDLSKLVPYADIIIESQKELEDAILRLELNIQFHHEKPRKKFRISLTEFGDFLPEEVDEVVYDIRKSKNPFSFELQMALSAAVDLEEASSEICSVNNVVINNIPRNSIMKDTVLRVIISPRDSTNPKQSNMPYIPEVLKSSDRDSRKQIHTSSRIMSQPTEKEQEEDLLNIPTDSRDQSSNNFEATREERTELSRVPKTKNLGELSNSKEAENPLLRRGLLTPIAKPTSVDTHDDMHDMNSHVEQKVLKSFDNIMNNEHETEGESQQYHTTNSEREYENSPAEMLSFELTPKSQKLKKMELPQFQKLQYPSTDSERGEGESIELEESTQRSEPINIKQNNNGYKDVNARTIINSLKREALSKEADELRITTMKSPLYLKSSVYKRLRQIFTPVKTSTETVPKEETLNVVDEEHPLQNKSNFMKIKNGELSPTHTNPFQEVTLKPSSTNSTEQDIEETTSESNSSVENQVVMQPSEHKNNISDISKASHIQNKNYNQILRKPTNNEIEGKIASEEKKETNDDEENYESHLSNSDEIKMKTPIRAYNNDENGILQYDEDLNLSNDTESWDDIVLNVTNSLLKVLPRNDDETLEITLNIIPPYNATIDSVKKGSNSVLSSLISSMPGNIVNVQTKVGKDDSVIVYAEIRITISPNNTLGEKIEEEEKLQSKIERESRLIENLTSLLDTLKRDVNLRLTNQNEMDVESNIKRYTKKILYSILPNILLNLKKSPNPQQIALNYSLTSPMPGNQNYDYYLKKSLNKLLSNAMPYDDIKIRVNPMKNNDSLLLLEMLLKPQTNFTTSSIDLDDLNILDMESVLTKIISDIVLNSESNGENKTIIIDFVFTTTRISSLNLENIESAIDDVLEALNLEGKLMSNDIKLGLLKNKDIVIHIPFEINTSNFKNVSSDIDKPVNQKKIKTPKPSEAISDLILEI